MALALWVIALTTASAQDLFLSPKDANGPPSPPRPTTKYTIDMKNAAKAGMKFPVMGLGTEGHGWEEGQKMECWHWPQCCTKDHCPTIDATREYIKQAVAAQGVARIDSGYPYGDNAKPGVHYNCGSDVVQEGRRLHPSCDTHGIGQGIKQAMQGGVKRDQIFVTAKLGYAGPMGGISRQCKSVLAHMDLEYADLCLIHLPEIGPGTGSHGQYGDDQCALVGHKSTKKPYDAAKCRVNTYANIVAAMNSGLCKSVGVNNWNVSDIQEIEKDSRNLPLPSVVQYKFHLHQSQNNQIQKDLVDYTKEKGIIFNGFAPLGAPDWVTFTHAGMANTTLEEPVVKKIAAKMSKTEAQILLRWVIQQGVATHARTSKADHMKENLGIFDFELSQEDMDALSKMPQCHTQRGLPYAKGDPNGGSRHDHVIGLTEHC